MKRSLVWGSATAMLLLAMCLIVAPQSAYAAACQPVNTVTYGWALGPWTGGCSRNCDTWPPNPSNLCPGAGDDVLIPSGYTVYVGINDGSTGGAAVAGTVTVEGLLIMGNDVTGNAADLRVSGDFLVNSTGEVRPNDNPNAVEELWLGGNFTVDGIFKGISNANGRVLNITFNGTGNEQVVGGTRAADSTNYFCNVVKIVGVADGVADAVVRLPAQGATNVPRAAQVINNGVLRQSKTGVAAATNFIQIRDRANTADTYRGLDLTPGGPALDVTVDVKGNHAICLNNGSGLYRNRCFALDSSAAAGSASMTLYSTTGEDDITGDSFLQYAGGITWNSLAGCGDAVGAGGSCPASPVSLTAGDNYFLIGQEGVTAVVLSGLTGNSAPVAALVLLPALGLVLAGAALYRRRRAS